MDITDKILNVLKVMEESSKAHISNEKEIDEIDEIIKYLSNNN